MSIVKKRDVDNLKRFFISKNQAEWFGGYIKDPEFIFCTAINHPEYIRVLKMASDFIKESGVNTEKVGFNEYFRNNLERGLAQEGYEVIESGKREGVVIVKRNGRHSHRPEVNVFHNEVGYDISRYDYDESRKLGHDEVKVISTLYTAVARKN